MPKVEEIMDVKVYSIDASAPIIKVAQEMLTSGRNVIPVCDDNERFRGIIAERDIITGIVAIARDPATEPASSLLNGCPVISPDDDIMDAAQVMVDKGVHVLPVVKNGRLLGLFTLESLARKSQALAALVFSKTRLQAFGKHREDKPNGPDTRSGAVL